MNFIITCNHSLGIQEAFIVSVLNVHVSICNLFAFSQRKDSTFLKELKKSLPHRFEMNLNKSLDFVKPHVNL